MSIQKFKSAIHCGGCLAKVSPILDGDSRINSWKVDLESPDKVLEIDSEGIESSELANLLIGVGFKLEAL